MTPADLAIDNAIHFEGVKVAYRQTKDGVVISFVVHPHDVPKGLAEAPLGSRYIVALVQVGDDEQPVPAKETAATPQPAPDKPLAGAKRGKIDWRDMQPAAQAALRCDQPAFRTFLMEEHEYRPRDQNSADEAAEFIRSYFGIKSRSELGTDHRKRVLWKQLDDSFSAWKILERA